MYAAYNVTNVVIAVISLLILALVALGAVMFIYCKSRRSLIVLRNTRRQRRGPSVFADAFKLPRPVSTFAPSPRRQSWYTPQPRQLQQQQQQPLFPLRFVANNTNTNADLTLI